MRILSLPNELLLLIAVDLPIKPLYRFLSTCHRLSSLLTPHFHKLALRDVGSLTALHWAARYGHASLAEIVLSQCAGGGVGSGKRQRLFPTPLHLAVEYNHPDVIRVLAKHGEKITTRGRFFSTPLHKAASQGSVHVIRVLLELGADMTWTDETGETPVHISAGRGDIDSMRAFIDTGLDFKLNNWLGRTVLHEAILNGKGTMVEFLLGHGGKKIINARDSTGKTPLHWAVSGGESTADGDIVKMLCYHGADAGVVDNQGNTPLGVAVGGGRVWLSRVLLDCLANVSDGE